MTKRRELVGNGDDKQQLEYAEICKTIKNKAREDIRKYNLEIIRETIMTSKSLKKVWRNQKLDRLITLLDKHGRKDHIIIETLKAGEDTLLKTLAKLYTKCLSERRIPTAWKNAKVVIIFKKGNKKYLKNYRPICLLSNIYKLLTKY